MFIFRLNLSLLILFIFPLFTIVVHGEKNNIGELEEALANCEEDTAKVELLINLTKLNLWSDPKLSNQYARQALDLSVKLDYDRGLALSNFYLAQIFIDFDFKFSEELILNALHYADKIGDKALIAKINNIIGHLKNNIEEYEAALDYFKQSLQYFIATGNDSAAAAAYNNMAISYINLDNDSLAIKNYFKAAEINERNGNYLWLASNYYNIGYDYLEMGDTVNGIIFLNRSLDIADNIGFERMYPFIFGTFGKFYLDKGNYEKALKFARKALTASREQMNRLQEKNSLTLLKDIYYRMGKIDSAYLSQQEIFSVNDSIKKYAHLQELDLLEMRHNFQEQLSQQELKQKMIESELLRKELNYTLIILAAGILVIVLIFLYYIQYNRMHRKKLAQKAILLEKEKLARELDYKKKELTTSVMYLMQKNEFISDISKKLQSIENASVADYSSDITKIISELDKNTSKEVWKEFETRFQEIYGDFYKRLSEKFPGLTPNDLKLCAFLKLNMSSKEISSITFQSADSLKIARHRLRQKLGLAREDNLVTFLNQI